MSDHFFDSREGYRGELYLLGESHLESERQFNEFNSVLPYNKNFHWIYHINSPRLVSILQSACTQVEALAKKLVRLFGLTPISGNFDDLLSSLDKDGMLSIQKVGLRDNIEILQPFMLKEGRKSPDWWIAYNNTKHNLPLGASCTTVGYTLESLAGLYVLLQIYSFWISSRDFARLLNRLIWKDFSEVLRESYISHRYRESADWTFIAADREYLESKRRDFISSLFYYLVEPSRN